MVIFILQCFGSFAQKMDGRSIDINVLNDTIICASEPCKVSITYSIKNTSDKNLILYRLASEPIDSPIGNMEVYCDVEKTGAGLAFFLFDENMEWKSRSHRIVSDYSRPLTKQRADSALSIANSIALKSTIALKVEEVKILEQEIDLTAFNLVNGRYYLQLLYYAGKRIDTFVSDRQISCDTASHGEVYQGCVKSDKVLLILD